MYLVLFSVCIGTCIGLPARLNSKDAGLFKGGFFQGDIAGIDPYELNDRSATVRLKELWPEGVVYYSIDESLEEYTFDIRDAMDEYESKTCIKFQQASLENVDFVNIAYMDGCWSKPGHRGGKQDLSLGDGCIEKGTIIHELGHVLGFYHEQSRSDRDNYIEVLWENVEPGQEPQFIKHKYFDNNLLDEKFDYKSIMLYDETTFSKDGESPTIRVLEPGVVIGKVYEKFSLSEVDVRKINKLYECNGVKRPLPAQPPNIFCDFEEDFEDDCGIKNLYGSGSFERKIVTLGGRTSTAFVVNALTAPDNLVGLATQLFHLYEIPEGCFSLDYYLNGNGVKDVTIFNSKGQIFITKNKTDEWISFNVPVYYEDYDEKFYVFGSVIKDKLEDGYIAIDNVGFQQYPCPKKNL